MGSRRCPGEWWRACFEADWTAHTGKGDYVLPFPAFGLEFTCVTADVCSHTSSVSSSVQHPQTTQSQQAITHCTPRSPVLNTSILFNPKHANISTLHLPSPLTATSFSISSSSLALMSIAALSSPDENLCASPEMYSALRWDRPAVRSVGRSVDETCAGVGKEGWVWGKRDVNFLRIEAAAAPETCSQDFRLISPLHSARVHEKRHVAVNKKCFIHTCCPITPPTNAAKTSTPSLNPSGLNIAHVCLSTSLFNFGSTLTKYASASFNSVSTFTTPGLASPTSGASASLALRRFTGEGSEGLMGEEGGARAVEDVMRFMAEGVGVKGGLVGEAEVILWRFLGSGVAGREVMMSSVWFVGALSCGVVADVLALRLFGAGAAAAILLYFATSLSGLGLEAMLLVTRVERLRDMVGWLLVMCRVVVFRRV